jgi:transcriptional regulator with XRE-family HTH domain
MSAARLHSTRFRRELLCRGLTQLEVARLANLTEGTVSRAARGEMVAAATVSRLLSALAAVPVLLPDARELIDLDGNGASASTAPAPQEVANGPRSYASA